MTGLPGYNYDAFNEAEQRLRHLGDVVNPAKIETKDKSWEGFMRADIKALMDCDTICLLPGWATSRGAKIELYLAEKLGMEVILYESLGEESA
jgi:hypothetical protein